MPREFMPMPTQLVTLTDWIAMMMPEPPKVQETKDQTADFLANIKSRYDLATRIIKEIR